MTIRIKPLVLAVAATLPALAQAVDMAPTLDAVTVTATRAGIGSTTVGRESIARQRPATSDTASLLGDVPGVSVYTAGGVSGLPVIHGLADDRNRIQLDGMDLIASCPNHMNSPLSYIDPAQVESIRVYSGIVPVSAGGDSIGGTIQVNSARPVFAQAGQGLLTRGEAGGVYRSNGNAYSANLAATLASETFSLTYSGATARSDNYKAGGDFKRLTATGRPGHALAKDEVGSTAYQSNNQNLGIAVRGGNHLFELKLGWQNIPYELYPNQRMDMLENRQERANLRYEGAYGWGKLEARLYHEEVNHFMDFGADKQYFYGSAPYVVAPGMPMYTRGKTDGAAIRADINLSTAHLLRLGVEAQNYRLDDWWPPSPGNLTGMLFNATYPVQAIAAGMAPNTFWNINNGKRDRLGAFAEWEAAWNPQWQSLLGLRVEQVMTDTGPVQGYNNATAAMGMPWAMYASGYAVAAQRFNAQEHKRTDTNLDWTALARYTPDESRTFEFGFAQKTRSPNLYERYSWSTNTMALIMNNFVGDGNGYLGNIDLKPEIAHTLSATGDWHSADGSRRLRITPYYTDVLNYIDAVPWDTATNRQKAANTAGQFGVLRYMNHHAQIYGIDLSGQAPLASTGLGEFGFRGLLSYTRGRNLSTHDGLYNIVPLTARATLTHQIGGWSNALEIVGVRMKDDVSKARQEVKTPGYSLVNLRASHNWNRVRLDLGIENLFDRFYYLPQGGTYSGQGMTMSLNGIPAGIGVPGMGRTFYLGLNIKF